MKIVAVLENTISAGGGFSQALSAILQIKKIAEKNGYTLQVVTSEERNIAVLHSLAIDCTVYRMPSYTKFFQYLIESSFMVKKVLDFMYKRNWLYPIERILTKQRPDILYFLQPSRIPKYLKNINFIYTLWDVGHRDFPEFPEVRREGVFLDRETAYKNILPAAFLTITDSDTLSARLQYLYNLDRERLLAMPFNINPLLGQTSAEEVVEHQDVEGGFLFYPAQFWPHKNHIRILQAILGLREQGRSVKVVFVGGDKLNQGHVRNFIAMNKLESQVKILGFVEIEEIKRLYQSCIALIMPTYFGPTNIPPFEAW
ncbi:MAG: glycosyltransferase, partial [Pedobacter sp.]|nr:glycosyltransferase [Pedobacter sp.]